MLVEAKANQVFLVQGQSVVEEDGVARLGGEIEQLVVVASDSDAMMQEVREKAPTFQLVGWATLEMYEATATRLRAAIKGEGVGWPVLIAGEIGGA